MSKALNEIHQVFIQNVSHELRTPLSIIQGYTELLYEGDLGMLSREQQEALMLIRKKSYELRSMVEQISILLNVQNGVSVSRPVNLAELVTKVVRQRQTEAVAANVELDLQIAAELPSISGDPYRLQEALEALVENGIKFTPAGGRVEVRAYSERVTYGEHSHEIDAWIHVEVRDTGIGIAEDELEQIFSGFYQVDGTSTRRYGGLGLGLTVVKAVIETHGGQIEVKSEPGRGSTFTLKLPVQPPEADSEKRACDHATLQRVLVVDDEVNVALFLQEALENLPHCEINVATSGRQALQLFKQRPFDLLITDYKMPATDGMALATEIRRLYPQTVVIMITAYADDELRRSAARIAIEEVLDKPVKLTEIRSLASKALGRSCDS